MTEPVSTPAEADSPFTSTGDPYGDPLTDDPDAAAEPDPDLAEEYAESLPVDPTPDEVERYLELAGAPEALDAPFAPDSSDSPNAADPGDD